MRKVDSSSPSQDLAECSSTAHLAVVWIPGGNSREIESAREGTCQKPPPLRAIVSGTLLFPFAYVLLLLLLFALF